MNPLKNIQIAIMHGHPYDTGAEGECDYNHQLVEIMEQKLKELGAKVYVHIHEEMDYGDRQDIMADAVDDECPKCMAVFELHYNAYNGTAKGHEFLYAHTPALARCVADEFQSRFPLSVSRSDNGIRQTLSGNGAGFLLKAPAAAIICEPFFGDNEEDREVFDEHIDVVADAYIAGFAEYLGISLDGLPTEPTEPIEPDPEPTEPTDNSEAIIDCLDKIDALTSQIKTLL